MAKPAWREIGSGRVPEREGVQWTQLVENVTPGKVIKIEVIRTGNPLADQNWTPKITGQCTADGKLSPAAPGNDKIALPGAPAGCLIGRLGGSSVDMTADSGSSPSKIMFSVGRFCVLVVPDSVKGGALFLGANDTSDQMGLVADHLDVKVSEAL
jgi:hypothetical protein